MRNIGAQDEFIQVQTQSKTTDSMGATVNTWADSVSFHGYVKSQSGSDFVSASNTDVGMRKISVITHYRTDILQEDRLVWASDTYQIVSVIKNYRDNILQIDAEWIEGRG